ncbi:hypothetical protein EGW08_005093 [Elysia chlorotica]|uniref:G-protein coupled receptors family 1 profile domain-containing protein n=1 Tax=Elysia chlorotica TaxID=188477 RepID=A0A433TZZ5_ELYCH|nr:hypothetical protein EGW08_005093 [Elysia chlorotica]
MDNSSLLEQQLLPLSLRNTLLTMAGGLLLLFALAGLTVNILNMLVFHRLGLYSSININFFALSAADFACASIYALISLIWLDISRAIKLSVDLEDLNFLLSPLFVSLSTFGSWVTAIISIERSCSILVPVRVKHIFTCRFTACLISAMLVAQLAILTASFTSMRLFIAPGGATSSERPRVVLDQAESDIDLYITVMFWGSSFPSFICFLLIVVSTFFLAYSLRQRQRWLQTLPGQRLQNKGKNQKRVATVTVVAVSAIYIACYLPGVSTVGIYFTIHGLNAFNAQQDNLQLILTSLVPIFQALSGVTNFFVYYKRNSRFRQNFKHLFYYDFAEVRAG